jgi:hypothetical protein
VCSSVADNGGAEGGKKMRPSEMLKKRIIDEVKLTIAGRKIADALKMN